MFITLLKEYFLPALLIVVILFAIILLLILIFPKTKKSKYVRENEGKVIWPPDLGVFVCHVTDNNYIYSKNGEDWEDLILPEILENKGDSICYSNTLKKFAIILGVSVYTSLDGVTWTEECLPTTESKKEMIEAKEVYNLINQLRNSEEGNAITIYHDNPDCWYDLDEHCFNNRIDVKFDFNSKNLTFFGNSLKECLQFALKRKEEKENQI